MLAALAQAEKQCQSVDRLEGEKINKVINMWPKCVCLGKSHIVNFLSSSEKKKLGTYKVLLRKSTYLIVGIIINQTAGIMIHMGPSVHGSNK